MKACQTLVAREPGNPRFRHRLAETYLKEEMLDAGYQELRRLWEDGFAILPANLRELSGTSEPTNTLCRWRAGDSAQDLKALGVAHDRARWCEETGRDFNVDLYRYEATEGYPWSHRRLARSLEDRDDDTGSLLDALFHRALAEKLFIEHGLVEEARYERYRRVSLARILPADKVVQTWRLATRWSPGEILPSHH